MLPAAGAGREGPGRGAGGLFHSVTDLPGDPPGESLWTVLLLICPQANCEYFSSLVSTASTLF